MDYNKSGIAKGPKNAPRHAEHNAKGSRKTPFGNSDDPKAALIARMKAAAEARKAEGE